MHVHAVATSSCRAAEVWLPDLAWAADVKGFLHSTQDLPTQQPPTAAGPEADGTPSTAPGKIHPGSVYSSGSDSSDGTAAGKAAAAAATSAVGAGGVTWRRLHAMGPTAHLKQQMELGLLAALSTTQ